MTRVYYVGWDEPIECTYDHKFLVKRNGSLSWIKAYALLPSDSVAFPKQKEWKHLDKIKILPKWRAFERPNTVCNVDGCNNHVLARGMCCSHYERWKKTTPINMRTPPEKRANGRYVFLPDEIEATDDVLYMLGWYVAEGFSSTRGGKGSFISLSGHEDETGNLKKIAKVFDRLGVRWTIYTKKTSKGVELRAYSYELSMWLMNWFGRGAKNKTLPKEILNLPPSQAATFLSGSIS